MTKLDAPIMQLLRMKKFALQFFRVEQRDQAIELAIAGEVD